MIIEISELERQTLLPQNSSQASGKLHIFFPADVNHTIKMALQLNSESLKLFFQYTQNDTIFISLLLASVSQTKFDNVWQEVAANIMSRVICVPPVVSG